MTSPVARLGAGEYSVTVSEWSGRMVWQSVDRSLSSVSWSRERCEMSKATVKAAIPVAQVTVMEPWVHLLTVYRNGELVWHGAITKITASSTQATLEAADGAVMFSRRRIPSDRSWRQHDATQVMRTMVDDACSYKDAVGMVEGMVTRESRIWVTASWTAAECMVDKVVDDLVSQGLVWTIAAGRLLVGPVGATHVTAQVQDRDFDGEITVVKDGGEVVTDALVMGKGVWGQWGKPDTPVGLLQSIEKADGVVRAKDCENTAMRIVQDACMAPRRLTVPSNARLMPSTPVVVRELVPGVQVPVSSTQTGVRVASMMEIESVDVTVDHSGEKVSVTLRETSVTGDVPALPDPADLDWRSPFEKEQAKRHASGAGSRDGVDDVPAVPPV